MILACLQTWVLADEYFTTWDASVEIILIRGLCRNNIVVNNSVIFVSIEVKSPNLKRLSFSCVF